MMKIRKIKISDNKLLLRFRKRSSSHIFVSMATGLPGSNINFDLFPGQVFLFSFGRLFQIQSRKNYGIGGFLDSLIHPEVMTFIFGSTIVVDVQYFVPLICNYCLNWCYDQHDLDAHHEECDFVLNQEEKTSLGWVLKEIMKKATPCISCRTVKIPIQKKMDGKLRRLLRFRKHGKDHVYYFQSPTEMIEFLGLPTSYFILHKGKFRHGQTKCAVKTIFNGRKGTGRISLRLKKQLLIEETDTGIHELSHYFLLVRAPIVLMSQEVTKQVLRESTSSNRKRKTCESPSTITSPSIITCESTSTITSESTSHITSDITNTSRTIHLVVPPPTFFKRSERKNR